MKKSKDNPRIVVTFEKKRYEELKQFCQQRGIPLAEAIRRGVELFMKERKG
jgi:Ribbon-helix-helix domain